MLTFFPLGFTVFMELVLVIKGTVLIAGDQTMNIHHLNRCQTVTLTKMHCALKGMTTVYSQIHYVCYKYSSPSISGHSHQRPPSLMWPQFFAAATMNAFNSPSHQRPPL